MRNEENTNVVDLCDINKNNNNNKRTLSPRPRHARELRIFLSLSLSNRLFLSFFYISLFLLFTFNRSLRRTTPPL